MSKIAIVYWSGTGNTEAMANILEGFLTANGNEVTTLTSGQFNNDDVPNYDAFAFGCPSMGSEELEDSEFAPMWDSVKNDLTGKKVALFGSYGWGDGEWMRNWEEDCANCDLVGSVIANDSPDDEATANLNDLASKLI